MAGGFGGGTALFIPIIQWLIGSGGYRTAFVATGVVQGFVILIVAQFLRHPPKESHAAATPAAASVKVVGRRSFSTLEMLRTPQFYFMYVMFVLMATGGLLVTAKDGPMARSWGLSAAALTLAATLSPIANGASRVFWGWASDRLGRENTMIFTFLAQAVCLFLVVAVGLWPDLQSQLERTRDACRAALSTEDFDRAWAAGRVHDLSQAAALITPGCEREDATRVSAEPGMSRIDPVRPLNLEPKQSLIGVWRWRSDS